MVEAIDGIWLQHNLAIAGGERLDASKVFVVPDDEVAKKHDVVAGVHGGVTRVAVPKLPNSRGTVLHHIAPTGVGSIGGHPQGNVAAAVIGEGTHEVLDAYDTC